MSRFLLLNFEDFGLSQDITKAIQPHKHFCICCLDRNGPMVELDKCSHKDYMDAFYKPELQQFSQLVCLQCHSILKRIKCFQTQLLESINILLSGTYTNSTVNLNRINNLIIQKVVDDLHLPPNSESLPENTIQLSDNSKDDYFQPNNSNIDENFTHDIPKTTNLEDSMTCNGNQMIVQENFEDQDYTHGIRNSTLEENFVDGINDNSNLDNYTNEINNQETPNSERSMCCEQNQLDIQENFGHGIIGGSQLDENYAHGIRDRTLEENFAHQTNDDLREDNNYTNETRGQTDLENIAFNHSISNEQQHRLNIEMNKNIKTALDILERNNQSFVSLGSQLQFLNGEHLSFLESSLLSKEILTDIPLVPAKNMNTDLENALHNSKSLDIEIDGPDKMFYDSLDLSPGLMGKETNFPDIIKIEINEPRALEIEPNIKMELAKPKKVRKAKKNVTLLQVKVVKLSQDQLNRERVLLAQSDGYLKHKFRCETCLIGFNYQENLEDHSKRKHGKKEAANVVCEICSQVVPTIGSMTEHKYRHYTRYECLQCSRRYITRDEAIQHCMKKLCSRSDHRSSLNWNPTPLQWRSRIKHRKVKT